MDERDVEQALRDERARRRAAESRIEELTERADTWRRRAEERADRIERIIQDRAAKEKPLWPLRRILNRGTTPTKPAPGPQAQSPPLTTPEVTPGPVRRRPSIKSVVVVSLVSDPGIRRCLESFDVTDLSDAGAGDMDRADLVVVEPEALSRTGAEIREGLETWSREPGRQPLVMWASGTNPPDTRALRPDVTVALPGCFDPARHRPTPPGEAGAAAPEMDRAMLATPSLGMIETAASGIGFDTTPGAGAAARRWAYRHHAPWVRARQLLDLVGLRAPDPMPRIAAILVSHRPESLPAAIAAMLRQTHVLAELVVEVHGAPPTPQIEALLGSATIPVQLLVIGKEQSLGEALNHAIANTSAPLLAKIDDDDHYGPAHLEDSFHALAYSGADIVGKGAHYTYVASRDTTILRRPGQEEMYVGGSPNGATLVFRRGIWDGMGFPNRPRHVDTGFLRGARELGATVYVGSRWEFCYIRNQDGHTWEAEAEVFTAGSEPAWDGLHPDRAEVPDVDPD